MLNDSKKLTQGALSLAVLFIVSSCGVEKFQTYTLANETNEKLSFSKKSTSVDFKKDLGELLKGKTEVSFDAFGGVEAKANQDTLNNIQSKHIGTYQCTELVQRFFLAIYALEMKKGSLDNRLPQVIVKKVTKNGTTAVDKNLQQVTDISKVMMGNILIYKDLQHVAIIRKVITNTSTKKTKFELFEQNWTWMEGNKSFIAAGRTVEYSSDKFLIFSSNYI